MDDRDQIEEIICAVRWLDERGLTVHDQKNRREQVERLIRAAAPEPLRVAETPGAQEAFRALDVADRIIERACGVDVAQEWNDVYAAVAEARSVSPTPDQPKPEVKDV